MDFKEISKDKDGRLSRSSNMVDVRSESPRQGPLDKEQLELSSRPMRIGRQPKCSDDCCSLTKTMQELNLLLYSLAANLQYRTN